MQTPVHPKLEPFPGTSWGLGVLVRMDSAKIGRPVSNGTYGWSGAFGTHFFASPKDNLSAVFMTNRSDIGGSGSIVSKRIEELVFEQEESMSKSRMEAFSDGVLAIIITIMVLELKVPEGSNWSALQSVAPVFAAYILSYIYVGLNWVNHHHLLSIVKAVDGKMLWANLAWLFAVSLIPVGTAWIGQLHTI